jgi:hypothetical protein
MSNPMTPDLVREMSHRLRGQAFVEQSLYKAGVRRPASPELVPLETGSLDNSQPVPSACPSRQRAGL